MKAWRQIYVEETIVNANFELIVEQVLLPETSDGRKCLLVTIFFKGKEFK